MRFLLPAMLLVTSSLAASADVCSVSAARPWITRWLAAWELTSRDILKLPDAPAPNIVFYDSACVYTTSGVSAGGASLPLLLLPLSSPQLTSPPTPTTDIKNKVENDFIGKPPLA